MTSSLWRPASEHDAATNETAFIEWLRATGRLPAASPDAWRAWAAADEQHFLDAVVHFAGLERDPAYTDRAARRAVATTLLVLDRRPDDAPPP